MGRLEELSRQPACSGNRPMVIGRPLICTTNNERHAAIPAIAAGIPNHGEQLKAWLAPAPT
jgi:hypothetical protein